jgi:hypothetical protein
MQALRLRLFGTPRDDKLAKKQTDHLQKQKEEHDEWSVKDAAGDENAPPVTSTPSRAMQKSSSGFTSPFSKPASNENNNLTKMNLSSEFSFA